MTNGASDKYKISTVVDRSPCLDGMYASDKYKISTVVDPETLRKRGMLQTNTKFLLL